MMVSETKKKVAPKAPKKRGRGRPPLPDKDKGDRYNVYLSKPVAQAAKKLGEGSLSLGLSIAVERSLKASK